MGGGAGSALSFTYSSPYSASPSSVTNSANQTLTFNYASGLVSSIVDAAGNAWLYGYGPGGVLASVTAPGPNPDVRTYHYEDLADNTLLTGISINGNRFSTYAYDASKRVTSSSHTGGEENDSFVYSGNDTILTDARQQQDDLFIQSDQWLQEIGRRLQGGNINLSHRVGDDRLRCKRMGRLHV